MLDNDQREYLRWQLEDAQRWIDGLEDYFRHWWTQDARIIDQSGLFAIVGKRLREAREVLDGGNSAESEEDHDRG